jgi:hypothetical protein
MKPGRFHLGVVLSKFLAKKNIAKFALLVGMPSTAGARFERKTFVMANSNALVTKQIVTDRGDPDLTLGFLYPKFGQ